MLVVDRHQGVVDSLLRASASQKGRNKHIFVDHLGRTPVKCANYCPATGIKAVDGIAYSKPSSFDHAFNVFAFIIVVPSPSNH
uniref:DDE_Tnp_ISL3 domain-containing protein n=1 Tax=Panagrellus redivivus TaxID=6233 RepID=A0A7E4VLQ0_PANRE